MHDRNKVNLKFISHYCNIFSGITAIHYNACHCMERILQRALPKVACAFRVSGMSPSHLVKRWINAAFLNILPWNEICNYVLIVSSLAIVQKTDNRGEGYIYTRGQC